MRGGGGGGGGENRTKYEKNCTILKPVENDNNLHTESYVENEWESRNQ